MMFRSSIVDAQWDTWCYFHNSTYYLYYLISERSIGEGFGVATSGDGVHWHDHGWAIRASDKMVHFLGTGSVWPDPKQNGRFLCNYSEHRLDDSGNRRQCILFAWSDDLIHWNKFGDDHIFWIDERYYERYGRWDCIYAVPRPDGGYFGTWTATPKGRKDQNGGIGFGISADGVHWQALPPAEVQPDADESGAMVNINGTIHAMFGHFGAALKAGMYAYQADSFNGPYRVAKKNAFLLRAWQTYFSRYFETPDGVLVNHHSMDGCRNSAGRMITYLAPFKKLVIDEEGIQRWMWWPGNEKLKGRNINPCDEVDFQKGVIMEGTLQITDRNGAELRFNIDDSLYGIRVLDRGMVRFLKYDASQNTCSSLQEADRQLSSAKDYRFRLLARRGMAEFYLNDHFMECCVLGCPDARHIRYRFPESDKNTARSSMGIWESSLTRN